MKTVNCIVEQVVAESVHTGLSFVVVAAAAAVVSDMPELVVGCHMQLAAEFVAGVELAVCAAEAVEEVAAVVVAVVVVVVVMVA